MEKSKNKFFLTLVFLQFVVNVLILFDIAIARQIVTFIYITFMPGLLIILLMKPRELGKIDMITFGMGLSIAFLMLFGLILNELGFLFGISKPLTLTPLLIGLNVFMLILTISIILRGNYNISLNISSRIDRKTVFVFFLLICLPIMSIIGAMQVTVFKINSILLATIALVALLISIGTIYKKSLPKQLYAIAILAIAMAIIFHSSLIFKYPISFGSDTSYEYFIYKFTENNAYWNPDSFQDIKYGRFNSMVSITILPTIYSTVLNMDALYVRKVIYPTIFAFVPLALFQLWRRKYDQKTSFLAVFLFVSTITFYIEMIGLERQMIAELFLGLLLICIFTEEKTLFNKVCFVIFSFALIISHYALAEIFAILIGLYMLFSILLTRKLPRKVTVTMFLFFLTLMFAWYIYVSHAATFEATLTFGDYTLRQLNDFFNLRSRETTILRALGLEKPPTVWNLLSRIFVHLTEFLIVCGFIGLITKRLKLNLEKEYLLLTIVATAFLALVVLLPGFSKTLNMTRFYHILQFLIAPLCILGADFLSILLFKKKRQLFISCLLVLVLVPYFLFQVGFVYELTGTDNWTALGLHRMDARRLYFWSGFVDDPSVFGVRWLSANVNLEKTRIFADFSSVRNILRTYGLIHDRYVSFLSNTTDLPENCLVYLNTLNCVYNVIIASNYDFSPDELKDLENINKIYSNGRAQVYKNIP